MFVKIPGILSMYGAIFPGVLLVTQLLLSTVLILNPIIT